MEAVIDGIHIKANTRGNIFWMSDWARVDELANRGLIRKVTWKGNGLYGHDEFYLK